MSAVLEEKRAVILNPSRMALAEQWRQDWVINVPEADKIEDVLDFAYWSHVAQSMQQFDRIEARCETGEWTADLIVTDVGRNWAKVYLVAKHDLCPAGGSAGAPKASIKHRVEWKGPQRKHIVVRISDGAVIQEGIATKEAAQMWLLNYETVTSPATPG